MNIKKYNLKKLSYAFCVLLLAMSLFSNAMNESQNSHQQIKECAYCSENVTQEERSILQCHPDEVCCVDCRVASISQHIHNQEDPHCNINGCARIIDENLVRNILGNQPNNVSYLAYNAYLDTKWKREMGIKPCPTPDCNAEFESRSGERSHRCPVCRQNYCPTCEFNHPGVTCQQAAVQEINCRDCNTRHARMLLVMLQHKTVAKIMQLHYTIKISSNAHNVRLCLKRVLDVII